MEATVRIEDTVEVSVDASEVGYSTEVAEEARCAATALGTFRHYREELARTEAAE